MKRLNECVEVLENIIKCFGLKVKKAKKERHEVEGDDLTQA